MKSEDPFSAVHGLRALLVVALLVISLSSFSQNITVKGKVTDAQTGEAMIGLNVIIKGTVRGVATDIDGNYTMTNCPPDAVLVFSAMWAMTRLRFLLRAGALLMPPLHLQAAFLMRWL